MSTNFCLHNWISGFRPISTFSVIIQNAHSLRLMLRKEVSRNNRLKMIKFFLQNIIYKVKYLTFIMHWQFAIKVVVEYEPVTKL